MFARLTILTLGLAILLTTGCSNTEPARFHSNMVATINDKVSPAEQQHLTNVLTALFGTPDDPKLPPNSPLQLNLIKRAAGPVNSDITGRKSGLYREHCVHCHGISGDGMGPTAAFLNPYPRDYRPGIYKFKSTTGTTDMPTDHDLMKTLVNGIPGSSMPSFRLLSDSDRTALVEYVKYLSLRGQTERQLYASKDDILTESKAAKGTFELNLADKNVKEAVTLAYQERTEVWTNAKDAIMVPKAEPDASFLTDAKVLATGRKLFYDTKVNCISCHGTSALGDGQLTNDDEWTKDVRKALLVESGKHAEVIEQYSLTPRHIAPRNLRSGIYRGGRRPIDLYYRIVAGINGSGMPAHATALVTEEERWAVVAYVLSLPYEAGGELGFEKETPVASQQETN